MVTYWHIIATCRKSSSQQSSHQIIIMTIFYLVFIIIEDVKKTKQRGFYKGPNLSLA